MENGLQKMARFVDRICIAPLVGTAVGRTADGLLGRPHGVFLMFVCNELVHRKALQHKDTQGD